MSFLIWARSAALDRELHADRHDSIGTHCDVGCPAEVDNVRAEFWVDDRTQQVANVVGRRWRHLPRGSRGGHALNLPRPPPHTAWKCQPVHRSQCLSPHHLLAVVLVAP